MGLFGGSDSNKAPAGYQLIQGDSWISPLTTGDVTGSVISYTGQTSQAKSFDPDLLRKNLNEFLHFAKLFCERYPNWTIVPSSSDPFSHIVLENRPKMLRIFDSFPMNEIEITGIKQEDYIVLFFPPNIAYNSAQIRPAISMPKFHFWALGSEELPELLQ